MATLVASYATEWLDLVFRWFHVTAAIVWIGTSFYFVALDNHLREPEREADRDEGVRGESWEIHGGGFYVIRKYLVAPPRLPKPLHWYKWEAYWTWLSGFALFAVLYYADARLRLIDPSVARLEPWQAILISIGAARRLVARLRPVLPAARRPSAPPGCLHPRPRHRGGVRGRAALQPARGVSPGRLDARDDHGRERLLRDHSRPSGAGEGEGGRPRARRPGGHRRQAALGAQQLPHAPRALLDAGGPLHLHVQPRRRLGGTRRADGGRGGDSSLLQPAPRGPDALVDPARLRGGDRRNRDLASAARCVSGYGSARHR